MKQVANLKTILQTLPRLPEDGHHLISDWTDLGRIGAKFFHRAQHNISVLEKEVQRKDQRVKDLLHLKEDIRVALGVINIFIHPEIMFAILFFYLLSAGEKWYIYIYIWDSFRENVRVL